MGAIDAIGSTERSVRRGRAARPLSLRQSMNVLAALVAELIEQKRSRNALLQLTDDQLKDIGLSRADAEREGLRRAWE